MENNFAIRKEFIMNTVITVTAYGENAENVINKVINKLKYLENIMSAYKKESDVCNINNNSGLKFIKVKKETMFVIKKAIKYSIASSGGFDITIKPLIDLWKNSSVNNILPSEIELEKCMKLVDYNKIEIFLNRIKLKDKNQKIDLGAIAKGYAADEAIKLIKKSNIESAIIDLGGDINLIGERPSGGLWNIGIRNPYENKQNIIGILKITNVAVVTSGDYERFLIINHKKYHHFFCNKTGYPINNSLKSITIVTKKAIDGDALASCCFSLGLERSLELVSNLSNVEIIIIDKNKKIFISSSLKEKFVIINFSFKLIWI